MRTILTSIYRSILPQRPKGMYMYSYMNQFFDFLFLPVPDMCVLVGHHVYSGQW